MQLNTHDKPLLIALRKGRYFKAKPGDAVNLLTAVFGEIDSGDALSSARRLHADGYAAFVQDSERPGRQLLRITDSGIALADNLIEATRKRTVVERVRAVPRSDWIAILALIVSLIALWKGK